MKVHGSRMLEQLQPTKRASICSLICARGSEPSLSPSRWITYIAKGIRDHLYAVLYPSI